MSEKKNNPGLEEELEAVEDDNLSNVAGGFRIQTTFATGKSKGDEIGIPGMPSDDSEDVGATGKLGVKR